MRERRGNASLPPTIITEGSAKMVMTDNRPALSRACAVCDRLTDYTMQYGRTDSTFLGRKMRLCIQCGTKILMQRARPWEVRRGD